jgi:bifunctional non-homologous end joining protein LigD
VSTSEAIEEGKVKVWMGGKKLQGGFALIRTDQEEPRWLLVKTDDEAASPGVEPDPEITQDADSVLTEQPLEELEESSAPA